MVHRRTRLQGWFVLVSCLALTASASESSALAGHYVYVPEQSADVAQAISKATERMNMIKRPIARSRLSKTNTAYQRVRLALTGNELEITFDARKPIRTRTDGTAIQWMREDGEVFEVSAVLESGTLVQRFKAEDGARVNTFSTDRSGSSLYLDVEVSSNQLPQPLTYRLVYRRVT